MDNEYCIKDVFTKENDRVNLEVNNASVTCLTSNNNAFNLDSEGNLTVKSINVLNKEEFELSREMIFDMVYPIGSIYLSMSSVNPNIIFGGVWVRIAEGRTLIGVSDTDTNFSEVNIVGGEKEHVLKVDEIPAHSHKFGYITGNQILSSVEYVIGRQMGHHPGNLYIETSKSGGSLAHNNLQPYLTCYIWQRIT